MLQVNVDPHYVSLDFTITDIKSKEQLLQLLLIVKEL